MRKRNASILVGLLWCVALLSVVVVSLLRSASLSLRVVKNHGDRIQAHYLALAGIEKTKAILFLDARQRREQKLNHTGEFYNSEADFKDVELGRGLYRVIRQGRPDESQRIVYGVSDEESRLNISYSTVEMLQKLQGLTPEIAASISDYRDRDSNVTQGGAEAEEYAALQPPYLPYNAPLRTDRELLMVRGVTYQSYAGEDANLNGLLDPEENDGDNSFPNDNQNGRLDAGWSGLITSHSGPRDLNAAGEARVNIQEGSETDLGQIDGITSDIATAITQYRGENELRNLADLLEVRQMRQRNRGNNSQQSPNNQSVRRGVPGGQIPPDFQQRGGPPEDGNDRDSNMEPTGQPLIDEQLLMRIADSLTTLGTSVHAGAVNINTAPSDVLICIPGIDEQIASAIIRHRESSGYFPNIAHLLKVTGINRETFKQIAPHVATRSETFRILSEGEVPSTGARKRIQAIVQIGSSTATTLAYREDL